MGTAATEAAACKAADTCANKAPHTVQLPVASSAAVVATGEEAVEGTASAATGAAVAIIVAV